jgi:2-amino-4-hydroxy-6-hydroxymethyldihydropteridine diphosphokinase
MATALIALGSNLGDRQRNLDDAVAQLGREPNIVVLATSRWRETQPIGGPKDQAQFLNGAALLGTSLTPQQLHGVLQRIEATAGRTRESRWAPRTLDLDLLLYDDLAIDTPELTVPHPRMSFRRFVLEPAAEIAPAMRHPTIGWTIADLWAHMRWKWVPYIAIAGPIAAGKTALAKSVSETMMIRFIRDPVGTNSARVPTVDDAQMKLGAQGALLGLGAFPPAKVHVTANSRRAEPPLMAISDFWIEQLMCYAELMYPHQQFLEYAELYRRTTRYVTRPRLLVVVDVAADVSWQRIKGRDDESRTLRDWLVRYRELVLKRVSLQGQGPVLRLDGTKLDEAKDELIAAIQAMQ